MPKNRSARDRMMLPGTIERVVVDTFRGQYRVRKWPKKRGTPSDPTQLQRITRFSEANKLAKFIAGPWWKAAHVRTNGTGLYPRDLLVQAMTAGAFDIALDDGTLITQKVWELNEVSFQGARLQRLANFAIVGGIETAIPWQDPIIQTWPFWSAATPTRITVPTNVTRIQIVAGVRSLAAVNGLHFLIIKDQAGQIRSATSESHNGTANNLTDTGVMNVVAGNWFDVRVFWGAAGAVQAVPQTFVSVEIKQTTP